MDDFSKMLSFDPLQTAEEMTGQPYDEDAATFSLGISLMQKNERIKREDLALRMDTYRRMLFSDAVDVFLDLGFDEVLSETFASRRSDVNFFKVFWKDGILLVADSALFGDDIKSIILNSCEFYYNWMPYDLNTSSRHTSSGRFTLFRDGDVVPITRRSAEGDEWVWAGHHSGSEAIRHSLARLGDHGEFLPKWRADPRPSLATSMDQGNYREATIARISRLPDHVQKAIAVQ